MNILVVCAHPDDEVLGCGATIVKHVAKGDKVGLICLSEGVTSRSYSPDSQKSRRKELAENKNKIIARRNELNKAMQILGVKAKNIFCYNFPDQRLDAVPLLDIVKKIEAVKKKIKPQIVYTHFWGDLNKDHRVTFEAVITAFRPINGKRKEKIYCFEIPETTGWGIPIKKNKFTPNHFVNIAETLGEKKKAISIYESEKRIFPHPRSIRAIEQQACIRGKESKNKTAEAFMIVPGKE